MVLSKENIALFSLLRHAVWQNRDEERIDFDLTTPEWQRLIENAAGMGVLAIAFDALPKGAFPGLSKELMIRWGLSVQRFEDRNRRQREALRELIDTFRENKIEVLLLKGLGLAENYPCPAHRECGDLDIYLFGDYEKGNEIIEAVGIEVNKEGTKHSTFFFKGIPVENHRSFLDVSFSQTNKNLEKHLHRILKEQGYQTVMIDECAVRIPTPDFTSLFLTRHNITHFFASGLVLRHLCDLSLFFSRNADAIDFAVLYKILAQESQLELFSSFIDLAQRYLGMPVDIISVLTPEESTSNKIFLNILDNSYRKIRSEDRTEWWVLKRKAVGAMHLFQSKWKYDLAEDGVFYKRLMGSLKAAFTI